MKKFLPLLLAFALLFAALPAVSDVTAAPEATPAPATTSAPEATATPETRQLMAVVKYTSYGRINMRAEPSEFSARVGVLSGGTLVKVLEQSVGRWVLVEGEGKTGYMSTSFLELFYEGDTPPIPVKTAEPAAETTVPPDTSNNSSNSSSGSSSKLDRLQSWPVTENTIMYVNTANGKNLNLRAGPSTDYSVITSFRVGIEVVVLHRRGNWAYVKIGEHKGFLMLRYLSYDMPGPTVPPGPEPTPIAIVTVVHPRGSFVYLRSSTTTNTTKNILARIPHGTQVELLSWGFWYSLIRYDGMTGYIVTSYLKNEN